LTVLTRGRALAVVQKRPTNQLITNQGKAMDYVDVLMPARCGPWTKLTLASALICGLATAHAEILVGVSAFNQISTFDSNNLSAAAFSSLSGLSAGETLVGIDLRPSNNTIYGLSSANRLYTIDPRTGVATFTAALSTAIVSPVKSYGIDFNPVADRGAGASLRVVSTSGDNYAVNVATGAVTIATSIAPGYSGVAYSNSDPTQNAAPATTQLYYLNSDLDTLAIASTGFNNPIIATLGPLGVNITNFNGFELFANGNAFAAGIAATATLSQLFNVNLTTGQATSLGQLNASLTGLTAAPSSVPLPPGILLLGSFLGLLLIRRTIR
jgi:hypothetical protein